jgi:hypothetical protein
MPQLYRIGSYILYFWSNESDPLEPVHIHIAEGLATANGTKIWITSTGHAILSHNRAHIPEPVLRRLIRFVEANNKEIVEKWQEHFGELRFYC